MRSKPFYGSDFGGHSLGCIQLRNQIHQVQNTAVQNLSSHHFHKEMNHCNTPRSIELDRIPLLAIERNSDERS